MSVTPIEELPSLGDALEDAKRAASYRAVDENLDPAKHRVVGIGSGSTVVYVAERIGKYQASPELKAKVEFICIPTGFQSRQLILDNGLRLGSIEQYPEVDIAFDGADEVDPELNLIKGGGACLFQEKLVSTSSAQFIVVADSRKRSPQRLGTSWTRGVPVEVVPSAYVRVLRDLRGIPGCRSAQLRLGEPGKAGPVVTDNNNLLIDADFGPLEDPAALHARIKALVGVVETGIFAGNAAKAYFGSADGSTQTLAR
ncbi:FACL077Cp [Eremothecium gossypii FDAG1]|nr:FACL077Cp [Eremothecium gossypii FDAG1]